MYGIIRSIGEIPAQAISSLALCISFLSLCISIRIERSRWRLLAAEKRTQYLQRYSSFIQSMSEVVEKMESLGAYCIKCSRHNPNNIEKSIGKYKRTLSKMKERYENLSKSNKLGNPVNWERSIAEMHSLLSAIEKTLENTESIFHCPEIKKFQQKDLNNKNRSNVKSTSLIERTR